MARVYKARRRGPEGFERIMALKVVRDDGKRDDAALAAALVSEARISGRLHHPNIVAVHDFGRHDGRHFVAMEWVEGADLSTLLRTGPLPLRHVFSVGVALADALHYIHTLEGEDGPLKMVHRDLKPSNVLLGVRGDVKLSDFGISRASALAVDQTDTGVTKGSIPWMSPEQSLAEPIDGRSDIFALGLVLFEAATGLCFNARASVGAIFAALLDVEARIVPGRELQRLEELHPGLAEIVRSCLRRDPAERPADARLVAHRLRELMPEAPREIPLGEWIQARSVNPAVFKTTVELPAGGASSPPASPSPPPVPSARPPPPDDELPSKRGVGLWWWGAFAAVLFTLGAFMTPSGLDDSPPSPLPRVTAHPIDTSSAPSGHPTLSPDGRRSVYVRANQGEWGLVLRELESGEEEPLPLPESPRLVGLSSPAWSPDGAKLAFHAAEPAAGLYIYDFTNQSVERVRVGGAHPSWSPDSRFLAFGETPVGLDPGSAELGEVFVVDVETRVERELGVGKGSHPSWSPDGRELAFWSRSAEGTARIGRVPSAGGAVTWLTDGASVDWNPVWDATGEYLYFLSGRKGGFSLHRMNRDGGELNFLSDHFNSSVGQIRATPDGRRIAFETNQLVETSRLLRLGPQGDVLSWAPSTSGNRRLGTSHPRDDGVLAFSEVRGGVEQIWLSGADGERRVTTGSAAESNPQWVGDELYFLRTEEGVKGLWRVPEAGQEPVRVDKGIGGLSRFVVRPDGRRIAASEAGMPTIVVLEVEEGREVRRRRAVFSHPLQDRDPVDWSPDGKKLLVRGKRTDGSPWLGIWTVDTEEVDELPRALEFPRFLNSNRLVFTDGVFVVTRDLKTGAKSMLHELPEGEFAGWLGVSPDRELISVHQVDERAESWFWELDFAGAEPGR